MELTKVIIIGAGGHAAEISDYLEYNNKIAPEVKIVGFLDDNPENYRRYSFAQKYLGSIKEHVVRKDVQYLIAIATIKIKKKIVSEFSDSGAKFYTLIHKTAYLSRTAAVGYGCIIGPHVNLGPNTEVGEFSLINSRCSLGHDTKLGSFNFIAPNVCFSGNTTIGNENLFGINSVTIPSVVVGNRNKIAAGMVLHQNVSDDSTVFYKYKERILAVPKKD